MARGTVINEPIVSQATDIREGYVRTFGDKPIERGKWVMDPETKQLVRVEDYVPPSRALDAPVLTGRFYENTSTQWTNEKGEKVVVDIGSRRKHKQFMRETGLTTADDFSQRYFEGVKKEREEASHRSRHETIARKLYEIDKP